MLARGFPVVLSADLSFPESGVFVEVEEEEALTSLEEVVGADVDVEVDKLFSGIRGLNDGSEVWLMWKGASSSTLGGGMEESLQFMAGGEPTEVFLRWSGEAASLVLETTSSSKIESSWAGGELIPVV